MTEDLPIESNRIEINNSGKIQVFLNQVGKKTHRRLIKKSKEYLRRAGYIFIFRQPFDISMNSHQCGTVKAGNDPKDGVVDKYRRVHGVDNLYIIDGGFFPIISRQ
jgi:choline dehydrogenase-like flavoprotein